MDGFLYTLSIGMDTFPVLGLTQVALQDIHKDVHTMPGELVKVHVTETVKNLGGRIVG